MDMKNGHLFVGINDKGAELTAITDMLTGYEFLWGADPAVWARHAPVLFPIVGKLKNNELHIDSNIFSMSQHGFARDKVFTKLESSPTEAWYELKNDAETLKVYPYDFTLRLGYKIDHKTLTCMYKVINTDNKPMHFSIGAHPGFMLPEANLEAFYIEFEKPETEERHLLEGGLFNGKSKPVLSTPTTINLSKALFDDDAIVFKNLNSTQLKLKHRNSNFCITLSYDGFPHMGIWAPKNNEQFICLEPWCGHADPVVGHSDIAQKEGIITLDAGKEFNRSYSLTFEV
jgi:galactose mutarotase-like enzyme